MTTWSQILAGPPRFAVAGLVRQTNSLAVLLPWTTIWCVAELVLSLSFILAAIWYPAQRMVFALLGGSWLLATFLLNRTAYDNLKETERLQSKAAWIGSILTLAVIFPVFKYTAFALCQQMILQWYLVPRLKWFRGKTWGVRRVTLSVALLFMLFHWPNPYLMVVTFLGGGVLVEIYLHCRNILVVTAIHVVASLTLANTLPAELHHNWRVGPGYYRYQPPGNPHNDEDQVLKLALLKKERSLFG